MIEMLYCIQKLLEKVTHEHWEKLRSVIIEIRNYKVNQSRFVES